MLYMFKINGSQDLEISQLLLALVYKLASTRQLSDLVEISEAYCGRGEREQASFAIICLRRESLSSLENGLLLTYFHCQSDMASL